MSSDLGKLFQDRRKELGIGVRELARRIGKSPALLTRLENEEEPPSIGPDTLRLIAKELGLSEDKVLVLAERTEEMAPRTELEVALYRRIQTLSKTAQRALLRDLPADP
ncbi:MAG: helix-turn-helix transcriptional regulator [Gemmatimonadales bacterium]|nr:helix-turn-helix transcriptional regulator [Gemmatimonadales bacterium]MDZ4388588.1 helix-turn-helix transcriptional regulator [Gemmatimonadales bacterium]